MPTGNVAQELLGLSRSKLGNPMVLTSGGWSPRIVKKSSIQSGKTLSHGSHFTYTGKNEDESCRDNEKAPYQPCSAPISQGGAQQPSTPESVASDDWEIRGMTDVNMTSHVEISVQPNPRIEMKRKFL